ncbi:EEP domain-containing protein [Ketobacter sp. MCCC 1A13808]|uniref:endonuclease/exonuclease/phosphatase family protein n=1 Tax=Ketobacter sp. MCCC 1A13808 TaxID=2602738 RepID=UPI000F164700|nr:endonuclease/exonuclease/phosphatase family protein [Ketobacter sp. MCCC 1A13808]MVF11999.1 EEP domain-containing protein [Ketobacter sp. MCCC 1A13808]RLP52729.1 MAG: EEP domain-containing protein [Ketobacter sp.]
MKYDINPSSKSSFDPENHPSVLRLLSYNIQAAIGTSSFHHYVTRSWRHVLPDWRGLQRLDRIGQVLAHYDLISLQEVDGGSLRSGFVNQVAYLADLGRFDYWYQQLNRNLGRFGQFSNGVLSRFVPFEIEDHKLPGLKGRGAIVAKYGNDEHTLVLVAVHLALSEKARNRQLEYVREIIQHYEHVIVMGDMNCRADQISSTPINSHLMQVPGDHHTYPSWKPTRNIDHILVSPSLKIRNVKVLDCDYSDHRPISMEVALPKPLALALIGKIPQIS